VRLTPRSRQQSRRLITLGALIILAVLLLTVGRGSGLLRPVISVVMAPLRPVTRLLTTGTEAAVEFAAERESYAELQGHVDELERAVAEMQVEIVRLREIEQDYYRIADLIDYAAANPDENLVTADVVGRDTSSYLRWIIINRGTRDGIQVGNPVISPLGLVGRVENVTANLSWVRLANDPSSAVNARLQNAGVEGTVIGQLQGGLRMEYIPQQALVEAGDLIVTSGLGGTFPRGIVIGQVISVQRQQADLFQAAEVRPTVDFDDLDIVSVVTSFEPLDLSVFDEEVETPEEEEAAP
jgi:rod shape-determining protein MreC